MVTVKHDGILWIFTVQDKDPQVYRRELDWINDNIALQSWQWVEDNSFVVDPPYGVEICGRLRTEGSMTVETGESEETKP